MPTFSCFKILYKVKLPSFINNHAVAKAFTIYGDYLRLISPNRLNQPSPLAGKTYLLKINKPVEKGKS